MPGEGGLGGQPCLLRDSRRQGMLGGARLHGTGLSQPRRSSAPWGARGGEGWMGPCPAPAGNLRQQPR